jgi:hypothetical protein
LLNFVTDKPTKLEFAQSGKNFYEKKLWRRRLISIFGKGEERGNVECRM